MNIAGAAARIVAPITADDFDALAWLCRMAGHGCANENQSRWAAQLFEDARRLRDSADQLRRQGGAK